MEVDDQVEAPGQSSQNGSEGSSRNVMASSGAVGSVSIALHPLVILNVSEHWTRMRAQKEKSTQVIGALIGKQHGRHIEVMNSFELLFDVIGDFAVIDKDYYATKEEQFKQVFSDLDFIGWYTTGEAPTEADIKIHKQICEINESPLLLKLNPHGKHSDLPVSLYESVIDLIDGEATLLFVQLNYTLATEEAERIGVDYVARVSGGESEENSLVGEHLQAQLNAVKMLHSRVRLVLNYVKAVSKGEITPSQEILREANSLSHRLPLMDHLEKRFQSDFFTQTNDVALLSFLGTLTRSCQDFHQFVTKFNMLYDRQGVHRRARGLFF